METYSSLNKAIIRMMRSANKGMSARYDTLRYGIMDLLHIKGSMRLSDIAAELDVNPSSITRTTKDMENEQLVSFLENPNDNRSMLVQLAAQGIAQINEHEKAGTTATAKVLKNWADKDIECLSNLLNRLVDDWENSFKDDK